MKALMLSILMFCFSLPGSGQDDSRPTYENQHFQAAYDYLFSPKEQQESSTLLSRNNQKRLNQFWEEIWKNRDPTPETEYNEIRQLFERRVDDSRLFAGINDFGDGWKKDRGRVYIIYGAPDEIVKSPYGPKEQSNVEVWIYRENEDEGSRRVEIVFKEELDDFILQTSITFPRVIKEERVLPDVPQRFDGR